MSYLLRGEDIAVPARINNVTWKKLRREQHEAERRETLRAWRRLAHRLQRRRARRHGYEFGVLLVWSWLVASGASW